MRIGIFCNAFWPAVGGVETGARGLAVALRGRGHTVVVFTRQPGGLPPCEMVDGGPVYRLEWNLDPKGSFPLRFLRERRRVRRLVQDWALDVVYSHFVSVHALYVWDCTRAVGVPNINSFRGNDAVRIAPRSAMTRGVYARLTATADVNLFCSAWLRDATVTQSWFRGSAASTGVLADAVDVTRRTAYENPPASFVLAAGRFERKKGFDLLLHAWAKVHESIGVPLLIAGDGPDAGSIRRTAAELGLGSTVRLVGELPHDLLLGLLERCDLCVVPSREEPYGIMVLEAQALGVPLVATRVGNIPALVADGATGFLCDANASGLEEAMVRAWRSPARRAIGEAGRRAPGVKRTYDMMAGELEGWVAWAVKEATAADRDNKQILVEG